MCLFIYVTLTPILPLSNWYVEEIDAEREKKKKKKIKIKSTNSSCHTDATMLS